ncbi:hypothetical protein EG68_12423 [Paragonimus skrjabini miyazakii]|uniref:Uncharacterized protein n=1 Tax=Paragonimus skrjabini miyazakii TaxID=59628 RepID=A0A8S9YG04_9TREM|nr:hypothetical protein EG68_12423 [Paragonimus skrjabini miyazakii]
MEAAGQTINYIQSEFSSKDLTYTGAMIATARARNDYLVQLVAINHSISRYFGEEAPETVTTTATDSKQNLRLPRLRQTFADDEEMEKLEEQIRNGWPDNARQLNELIRPNFKVRDELTTENGLVLPEERLVIPRATRKVTMQEIHRSHLGVRSCTWYD